MLHSFTANPDVSFPQTDTQDEKQLKHETLALHHYATGHKMVFHSDIRN